MPSPVDQFTAAGGMLITQPDAPGRVFAYLPSNNANGMGGPDQVHEITDPNNLAALGFTSSMYKDLSTLPKQQTGNVQQNFLYGKASGANLDANGFANLLGQFSSQSASKASADAALAASNAKLGGNAFTGKPSDFANPSSVTPNSVQASILAGNGSQPTPTPGTTYQIKQGDTLSQIAQSFGTDVATLAKLNGIADPNKIQAGATLKLPDFKTIVPTSSTSAGITSTEGIRTSEQLSNLQLQKDALTKYGLSDTTQLTKDANGNYVPTQDALTGLMQNKLTQTSASSALSTLLQQGAPQLKDLDGNPVTEQTLITHLQAANGVTGLQTKLNDINQQISDAQQALKQGVYDEEGKLKSMASMSASERRMQEQSTLTLNTLVNQQKAITDQLTTANNVVKTMMDAANQDYTNATAAYDKQYSQAIQLQQLLDNESNTTVDNARANLTIMLNNNSGTPSASTLATMNKLAMQAGWPDGLVNQVVSSGIQADYTTTGYDKDGNQVVSFFSKKNGGTLIKSVTTPGVKSETAANTLSQATSDISNQLQSVIGKDNKVAPENYNKQKSIWQSKYGLSGKDFDNAFSGMVDSSHMQDYNINY